MPTLADALRSAPTTRPFRADPFPLDLLERALELAGAAGTADPWRAVAVTDVATRTAIRDAYLPHWHAHLEATGAARIIADDAPANAAQALRRADALVSRLHDQPVHLAVVAEAGAEGPATAIARDLPRRLADEGLAATPLPAIEAAGADVGALLGVPPGAGVVALLLVGHRAGALGAPRHRTADAYAHRDRFAAGW